MSNFDPVEMSFQVPWDFCCDNFEFEVVLNYTENNIIECTVDLSSWQYYMCSIFQISSLISGEY